MWEEKGRVGSGFRFLGISDGYQRTSKTRYWV